MLTYVGDPGGPSAAPKATRKSCHTSTRSPALISPARLEKTAPSVLTNTGVVFAITRPAFAALLGGMTSQASTCEYAPSGPIPRSTPMRATVAAKSGGLDNGNVATGPSELLHAASVATPKHKRRQLFDRMRPPRLGSPVGPCIDSTQRPLKFVVACPLVGTPRVPRVTLTGDDVGALSDGRRKNSTQPGRARTRRV